MALSRKKLRYYWWILLEFTKKNIRLFLLSFFLSVISIISIVSIAPYLVNFTAAKKDVVGMVGTYDVSSVPDSILSKISNGLLFINEKGEVVTVLADSWETRNGGKEYRFHLKKDLYWNNGDKFTAKDIHYNFKDITVEVPNDNEIIFKLKQPLPIFPSYLTKPIIKYPLVGVAGLYKIDTSKIQSGYVQELDLAPNKPNFPLVQYKFYENETKMINAYKLGQINEMTIAKKSIADTFKDWKNTEISKSVDYTRLLTLFINNNNQTLKSKEVRQAIAMSISREKMSDLGELANGPIPPISWANNPQNHQQPYNPDLAKKILKSDKDTQFTLSTYDEFLDISDSIQQDLNDAGLKVSTSVLSESHPSSFDLLLAYWQIPLDPDQYYYWHSTQSRGNITGYKNDKVDKLLEDGRNTISISDRKKIYNDFQKVLVDDVPAYFLYYPYIYTIKRK